MTAGRHLRRRFRPPLASAALLLAAATASVSLGVAVSKAGAVSPSGTTHSAAAAGSAMTKSGTGAFANLKVTVSQTQGLTNQVITISWTGGAPTVPSRLDFTANYLQIMQCWGSNPSGPATVDPPDRTQCEFGGNWAQNPTPQDGDWTATRQVNYGFGIVDPNEHQYLPPPGSTENSYVPFDSVAGTVETGGTSQWFDSYTTNEYDFGRTYGNGTGVAYFNVLPAPEAPALGCGAPLVDAAKQTYGRPCWLVIVPRGTLEVNGKPSPTGILESSPLSQTNWDQRIVFPLQFQPVSSVCGVGRVEVPVVGDEVPQDALTSWQPQLCKEAGGVTFSEVSDDQARTYLASATPDLDLVGQGAPPSAFPTGTKPVYAPIAINAVGIAFNIDWQAAYGQPQAVQALDGRRINSLKLTPLLVAKLLTQSYRLGADPTDPVIKNNPLDLSSDPEFLALNPEFKLLRLQSALPDILTPIGSSDAITELWQWVLGNPAARRWLAGAPDHESDGMIVNPYFKGITAPPNYFPKNDPYCMSIPSEKPMCLLDEHPYSNGLHDGARSISRGLSEATTVWNASSVPPNWGTDPPQADGAISLLAFTDLSTADTYDLPMAALQNEDGNFVTPTSTTMSAALGAMTHDPATGLLQPNPNSTAADAYPLTTITYAATVPSLLSASQRDVYSALLRYAAGPGQQTGVKLGQLPPGYLPLTSLLAAQTLTAAKLVASGGQTGSTGRRHHGGTAGGTTTTTAPTPTTVPPTTRPTRPVVKPPPKRPVAKRPSGVAPAAAFTPADPVGPLRMVPLLVLIVGAVAGLSGIVLLTRRRRQTPKPEGSPAPP
ncbi:MAG: hypothetical protein ACLQNG_12975 [Acidimicrobiales bacterium]